MGERAYELRKNWFGGPQAAAACWLVALAVVQALEHDYTGFWIVSALAVLTGGSAAFWLLWRPYRIVLDDAGIRMVSRVRPPVVVTSGLFADLHQMLGEIERRAPHVSVRS